MESKEHNAKGKHPSLIFVHGAWCSPAFWEPVISLLQDRFVCHAPQLPTSFIKGVEPVPPSNVGDIAVVQNIIKKEIRNDKDVVLVAHSFGGIAAGSSIQGFSSGDQQGRRRVVGLVLLTAVLPDTGVSAIKGFGAPGTFPPCAKVDEQAKSLDVGVPDPKSMFFDLPESEQEKWVKNLRSKSIYSHTEPDSIYSGQNDVKVWYLRCSKDTLLPAETVQDFMIGCIKKDDKKGIVVRDIDSGHFVLLSRPQETAQFIEEAVRDFVSPSENKFNKINLQSN